MLVHERIFGHKLTQKDTQGIRRDTSRRNFAMFALHVVCPKVRLRKIVDKMLESVNGEHELDTLSKSADTDTRADDTS